MEDVVMVEPAGIFHGVKSSHRLLRDAVPDAHVVGSGRDSSVVG